MQAVRALLAFENCDALLKNARGLTAAMDAERAGKGDLVVLILQSLGDEDKAAIALGHEEDDEKPIERVAQPAGVDKTLDGSELRAMQAEPSKGGVLPATRGVLSGGLLSDEKAARPAPARTSRMLTYLEAVALRAADVLQAARADGLVTRERPLESPAIVQQVAASAARRVGDWRYSVMPAVLPVETTLALSQDFFRTTELLTEDGNTFGPEFEQQYAGRKNYFYHVNRNQVIPGTEKATHIFAELDAYTRQVVELHHPGVPVRLERAFGAYYEGERDGFHLGVNEHCDGDANLVSTVVHAVLPDGDVGFSEGGELTVSEVDELPARPIAHSNATVGTVVYLGASVFHHASPIKLGSRRLVFCMFYASEDGTDLSKHALA